MTLIGIDLGRKKTGVAMAKMGFASPLEIVETEKLLPFLLKLCEQEKPEKIIISMPTEPQNKFVIDWINKNSLSLGVPVETYDETLSTYEAKKRTKGEDDAYAACVLLENYIAQF